MRRVFDGLLIASCAAYTLWTLVIGPRLVSGYADALIVAATAVACGVVSTVVTDRRRRRVRTTDLGPIESGGTLLAWVPVSFAIVAGMIHLAIYHRADNASIVIAGVIGATLGVRQAFAMRDIRTYAGEMAIREASFKQLALTDPLTNLGNRRAFAQSLEQRVVGGTPSVVLSIDLDGFKNINDLRGHDVGDSVLVEVAGRLRANLRPDDFAARLGGDEFAVVLWSPPAEAAAAASRLCSVLAAPYDVAGCALFLSASIGMAPGDGAIDVADLMRNADLALRFAKLRGKNRVEGYAEAYTQWLRRRITVETELRGAIGRGEFSLLYQPVVALGSGAIVGVEALLRWHHPALGAVLPSEFVPIAEECHLIEEIGRWTLGEACRQLAIWVHDGWDLWLSVDVSVHELHRSDFVAQVTAVLGSHRLAADRLLLEVAEHAAAVEIDDLMTSMAALQAAGVRVALDDFGAGYSRLGQMHLVPADVLKVDVAVVEAAGLADVVVRLGRRLDLDVIVAGVADVAQQATLEAAGCAYAQGDAFAAPMRAEHLEARLAADLVPAPRPPS